MLSEKNDVNVGVNGMLGNDVIDDSKASSYAINVQAAYSPVNHIGVMVGYNGYGYDVKHPDEDDGRVDAYASLFEAGVGGYYPIIHTASGLKLVADAYAGYGGGTLKSDVNMNMFRLFLQPGINLHTNYFDVGVQNRLVGVKFSHLDAKGRSEAYLKEHGLQDITDGRTFFYEPAVTLRGGYKLIKLQVQQVWSIPVEGTYWNYDPHLTTIGLFLSIDDFFRSK